MIGANQRFSKLLSVDAKSKITWLSEMSQIRDKLSLSGVASFLIALGG